MVFKRKKKAPEPNMAVILQARMEDIAHTQDPAEKFVKIDALQTFIRDQKEHNKEQAWKKVGKPVVYGVGAGIAVASGGAVLLGAISASTLGVVHGIFWIAEFAASVAVGEEMQQRSLKKNKKWGENTLDECSASLSLIKDDLIVRHLEVFAADSEVQKLLSSQPSLK